MIFTQIYSKDYPKNKINNYSYQSNFFYHIILTTKKNNEGWNFDFQKTPFLQPFNKSVKELLFQSYKESAEYYVVKDISNLEIAVLVIGKQNWNNTARLHNINIFNEDNRKIGIGTEIIQFAENRAKTWNYRSIVLECQSSNYPAVQFYLKCGYQLTGFDAIAYSNNDIEKHEVRLEMSKMLRK